MSKKYYYVLFSFLVIQLLSCKKTTETTIEPNCNCATELDYVVGYYERNLPGYKDNVTPDTQEKYNQLKEKVAAEASQIQDKTACFKVVTYYVEFFKDNHSRINMAMPQVAVNNKAAVQEFITSETFIKREMVSLSQKDMKQYALDNIKGLYRTQDGTYTIAILENNGPLRKYIGVITETTSPLWKKGQVKMELNPKTDGSYEAFVYMQNHSLQYNPNYKLVNGMLGDSWFKTTRENFTNPVVNNNWNVYYEVLNDSISYLRIPTFSYDYSAKLDSLYAAAKPTIEKLPYLIIDVRNNGGGSDSNVEPLLDYIYTKPLKNDKVDLWVTEENIAMWERWYEEDKKDTINYTKEDIAWYEEQISLMKNAPLNTFVNRSSGEDLVRDVNPKQPKKVAILQNKYCASSCETLLFWAKQSDNSILLGENSGGYVGYGEVGNIRTPCFDYNLYTTMTRYEEERKYEVIGITPDVYLNNKEDWIQQSIKLLNSK